MYMLDVVISVAAHVSLTLTNVTPSLALNTHQDMLSRFTEPSYQCYVLVFAVDINHILKTL